MRDNGISNQSPNNITHSYSPTPTSNKLSPEIQKILPDIQSLGNKILERPQDKKTPSLLGRAQTSEHLDRIFDPERTLLSGKEFQNKCITAALEHSKKNPKDPKINPFQEK